MGTKRGWRNAPRGASPGATSSAQRELTVLPFACGVCGEGRTVAQKIGERRPAGGNGFAVGLACGLTSSIGGRRTVRVADVSGGLAPRGTS